MGKEIEPKERTHMDLAPGCALDQVSRWIDVGDTVRLSDFLKKRHEARFFKPIQYLRDAQDTRDGYGFSMMALCCLLVETIECYRQGMPTSNKNEWRALIRIQDSEAVPVAYQLGKEIPMGTDAVFKGFFQHFAKIFPEVDGACFYSSIRCGLLHQAQTKNGWTIDTLGSFMWELEPRRHINRNLFANAMKCAFDEYVAHLGGKMWGDPEWKKAATKIWWLVRLSRNPGARATEKSSC